MMKVLVTGGAGFIGSWLCQRLVKKGYDVICLDNLSSGRRENIAETEVEFVAHDVRNPIELKANYVFHLASRASPTDFNPYALDIMLANSLGTYNMLELARRNDARFLLASSSEVYGDPLEHPQREDHWGNVNPIGPRSCYDESKRFSEALTMSFHRKYNLDVRIARLFNTYGERMRTDDGRVIPNFITQILQNQPITVYGDGSQTRSFCYISDMVEGLMKLMFAEDMSGQVVNLGNPKEMSILEAAKLVQRLTTSNPEIVFNPLPEDDPKRRMPDITRAREKLGWEPKIDLEWGLNQTLLYFKAMLGGT